jgi:hypothetical protein
MDNPEKLWHQFLESARRSDPAGLVRPSGPAPAGFAARAVARWQAGRVVGGLIVLAAWRRRLCWAAAAAAACWAFTLALPAPPAAPILPLPALEFPVPFVP